MNAEFVFLLTIMQGFPFIFSVGGNGRGGLELEGRDWDRKRGMALYSVATNKLINYIII